MTTETAIDVSLTWSEVMQAAVVGVMRQVSNLRAKRRDAHGFSSDKDGWGIHVEGCCGEMAAAKVLRVFWSGSHGELNVPDVTGFQVRTRSKETYELILHESDPDDALFVLVVGRAPRFKVIGWCRGLDGKRREWFKDPAGGRPAFFVPQSELRPISELW